MDYITLLIKGTMADAVRELAARCLVTVSINTGTSSATEVVARVPYTTHTYTKVAVWYCTPPSKAPYLPGALLHYTLPEPLEAS